MSEEIQKTYANGYVGGPGEQATIKLDDSRTVKLYRAYGGGGGVALLNLTDGGEGLAGHHLTDDHKAKIAAAIRTGATCSCIRCGEKFWRKASQIAKGQAKFCSRQCSNIHNKGGRRGA